VGQVSKKKRRPSKPSSPRSGRTARGSSPEHAEDEWDLLDEVEVALAANHPLAMLQTASAVLNAVDRRNDHPLDRSTKHEQLPLPDLLSALLAGEAPAAAALAWTMSHLSGDEVLRARVVRDLGPRSFLLPSWMQQLNKVEIVAAEQVTDTVRDGYDIVIHARLAGHDLTTVTFIDFNMGMLVKDNLLSDGPLESFNEVWREHADTRHTALEALSPADARARISDAIEVGAMTWPPVESEDWPAGRPLLEWILRQIPDGGRGFVRPEWSEEDREALTERFLASSYGAALDQPDDRLIVGNLIWYRADYGYGDPLRWSPTAIEILMLDWYPRKIVAGQRSLRRMPIVLRDFVRFVHDEIGMAEELTAQALDAIDLYEYEYRETVSRPRRQGPEAILEAVGALDPPDDDLEYDDFLDPDDLKISILDLLADEVGGRDQLAALTPEPLADEPFDWGGLSTDVHDRVNEVLGLCDACCDHHFDAEHRTAVRRLLHDVAVGNPQILRRGKAETAAAALCWMVARANESVGYVGVQTQDLMRSFGLNSTPSTRANTMRKAIGLDATRLHGSLGSPRYLTGALRQSIIAHRDQVLEPV
jgi:Domain of unknown function (DUF6398)